MLLKLEGKTWKQNKEKERTKSRLQTLYLTFGCTEGRLSYVAST